MKRMYVPPRFRGQGLGRQLGERIIAEARAPATPHAPGHHRDEKEAIGLYRSLGFQEIPPTGTTRSPGRSTWKGTSPPATPRLDTPRLCFDHACMNSTAWAPPFLWETPASTSATGKDRVKQRASTTWNR